MTRRFEAAAAAGGHPRLDGRELVGVPVRLYRRKVLGVGVLGLWVGGRPVYDVAVYDPNGKQLGHIASESPASRHTYDELRRALVADDIHA